MPDPAAPAATAIRRPWRWAVGVGSNRGDRAGWLRRAAELIDASGQARVAARSPAEATDPVGGPAGQEAFLNAVWAVESDLGPHGLLHLLQAVETACGRARTVRWGPRTLDLDLLAREDGLRVASPVLSLPHPLAAERGFVLGPWRALAAAGGWDGWMPGVSPRR